MNWHKNTLRFIVCCAGMVAYLITISPPILPADTPTGGMTNQAQVEKIRFRNGKEFARWTMNYYRKPEPEKLAWVIIRRGQMATDRGMSISPHMNLFFAMALQASDTRYFKPSFRAVSNHGNPYARKTFGYALWFIDTREANHVFQRALDQWHHPGTLSYLQGLQNTTPADLDPSSNPTGVHMDSLWSVFLATGKENYVRWIIPAITLVEEGRGREIIRGEAAQWSLTSNAIHHERVLKICEKVYEPSDGLVREKLGKIIKKVKKKRNDF